MAFERKNSVAMEDEAILVEGSSSRKWLLDLAAGGPLSRRQAVLLDPSLSAIGRDGADFTDEDVAEIKAAVAGARRLQRVESSAGSFSYRLSGLVAALTLVLLFLQPGGVERFGDSMSAPQAPGRLSSDAVITHPVVEAIGLPGARVYELAEEGFSVVLIVDESFEL